VELSSRLLRVAIA